jgi:hypothetical protein
MQQCLNDQLLITAVVTATATAAAAATAAANDNMGDQPSTFSSHLFPCCPNN